MLPLTDPKHYRFRRLKVTEPITANPKNGVAKDIPVEGSSFFNRLTDLHKISRAKLTNLQVDRKVLRSAPSTPSNRADAAGKMVT